MSSAVKYRSTSSPATIAQRSASAVVSHREPRGEPVGKSAHGTFGLRAQDIKARQYFVDDQALARPDADSRCQRLSTSTSDELRVGIERAVTTHLDWLPSAYKKKQ